MIFFYFSIYFYLFIQNCWHLKSILFFTICMHWTKNRLSVKIMRNFQRNLMTMNQTACLAVIFYFNSIATYCLPYLEHTVPHRVLFIFEICRIIVVENILLKIILPLVLIVRSRTTLPALWMRDSKKEKEFYFSMGNIKPRNDLMISLENGNCHGKFSYLTQRTKKFKEEKDDYRNNIIFVKQRQNGKLSLCIDLLKVKRTMICRN